MKMKLITLFFMTFMSLGRTATIPDFKLPDLENRRLSFSDIKGERLTVIDFWATWCKPCVRAIPKLVELQDNYSDKGVRVVGINVDSPRNTQKVKPFSRSLGVNYPILLDMNSELSQQLQVSVLPTIFIADSDGEILFIHQGYRPGDDRILVEKVESLIQKLENGDKN